MSQNVSLLKDLRAGKSCCAEAVAAIEQLESTIAEQKRTIETLNCALDAKITICGDEKITELKRRITKMTTAVITATFRLNLDSECWPSNMTDEEKVTGWVFAARMEPDEAFANLVPVPDSIEGRVEE